MSRAYRELVEAHAEIYGIDEDTQAAWKQQVEQWDWEAYQEERRQWETDKQAQAEYAMWVRDLYRRES